MAPKTIQFPIVLGAADDGEHHQETAAVELEDDIIEEILSWVPAKSVVSWKSVSKPWQRMLDNPIFCRSHFSRAPVCALLVSGGKAVCRSCRIVHLVEGRSAADLDSKTGKSKLISRFDIRNRPVAEPSKAKDVFLGLNTNATSCEGLLCWTAFDQNRGDRIIVCNPIAGEYVSLPSSPMDEDEIYNFIGLGFVRATNKFELLRMAARADEDEEDPLWWPEVRGVGESSWRRVGGGTSQMVLCRTISQVVYINGSIYWCYDGDLVMCCFDFDKALFQILSLPKMSRNSMVETEANTMAVRNMSLGVLDNKLCASLIDSYDGHVELSVLEDVSGSSGVQWKKLHDVKTRTTDLEHCGVLWPRGRYKAIKYLSKGEILMHDWRGKFVIYDPVSKEERHVCLLEDSGVEEDLNRDGVDDLQVISHVPCLVKLEDVLRVDGVRVQGQY